ncbi:hypothetical protein BJV82DRAFT_605627 [Fennellomyces sp. T-0311]|nr:hypothetical protein BJV82DRAFT_632941 [Fennellomyces sp. T-0311]KAI8145192.1 hypothetical protein BJV82DRAFT_605250 [Fennellomyces sp. T-0311]KAI8145284.1 hypothetical protein BJV82DRAFT_605627 [Fennellomyces sp. T-0311]
MKSYLSCCFFDNDDDLAESALANVQQEATLLIFNALHNCSVSLETTWKKLPEDFRKLCATELEQNCVQFGVRLDECRDQWAANWIFQTKWGNMHRYRKRKRVNSLIQVSCLLLICFQYRLGTIQEPLE